MGLVPATFTSPAVKSWYYIHIPTTLIFHLSTLTLTPTLLLLYNQGLFHLSLQQKLGSGVRSDEAKLSGTETWRVTGGKGGGYFKNREKKKKGEEDKHYYEVEKAKETYK